MIPFLKRCNQCESSLSFQMGFIVAMEYAFNILSASFLLGALQMTFQVKLWSMLCLTCFAGFEMSLRVLCPSYLDIYFGFLDVSHHKYIFVHISYMLGVMIYLLIEKEFLFIWSTILLFNKLFGRYLIFATKRYLN